MDPNMMQSAMEAMSRATPEQLDAARRQMASMSPEMVQEQMRMFQNMTPQQQADVRRQAASVGAPGAGQGPLQALNAVKAEGNKLHTAGQYAAACAKYEQVLSSIQGDTREAAAALAKSCTLNLSSCYLNQGKHQKCIEACSSILACEPSNRKALYRRGQAHLAASEASSAVRDLQKALSAAPADEKDIIRAKLEAARKLAASQGVVPEPEEEQIEEINAQPPARSVPAQTSFPQASAPARPAMPSNMAEQMRGMADQMRSNPAMAEQMRSMMQGMDPEQFKMMARMSGMGDVPDISPEQLREASARMAGMSPDDLARAADLAQAQQMRNGPSATAQPVPPPGQGAQESLPEVSGRAAQPGSTAEASTSAPAASVPPAASPGAGFDFSQAAAMMQNNPDLVKQAMNMMSNMPQEQMENMRRMAMGNNSGQPGGMGPGGLPDMSAMMSDPNMMASMQSMLNSLTPAQMVDMAKQAGVNLNEQQAEQISTQLKKLKPWQLQMLARGATLVQWLQKMTYQQKMTALGVLVLLIALFMRWVGWL